MRSVIMIVSGICMVVVADGAAIWKLTGHTIDHLPLIEALIWISFIIFLASGFLKRKAKNEQRR